MKLLLLEKEREEGRENEQLVYLIVHYHCRIIESFRPPVYKDSGPDKNGWCIGRGNNWREVFGDNPKTWFLPVATW